MKITDMRYQKSEMTEYQLGQVFMSQNDLLMVCKYNDGHSYFLVNLKTATQITQSYSSLESLWEAEHNLDDETVIPELVIREGDADERLKTI